MGGAIAACAKCGEWERALSLLVAMRKAGVAKAAEEIAAKPAAAAVSTVKDAAAPASTVNPAEGDGEKAEVKDAGSEGEYAGALG